MAQELQRPRITEIHVRMDCNGCVQKIKRALHGISGIHDLYIDFPNQKLTIVGWADPQKIVKAIKKTRKTATICSHTETPDPAAQTPEQPPDGGAPPSDSAKTSRQEAPPAELPKDTATAPPSESSPPSSTVNPNSQREPEKREGHASQDGQQPPAPPPSGQQPPAGPEDVGDVHVVYHHPPPPEYGYRYGYGRNFSGDPWYASYPRGQDFQQEYWQPPPVQQAAPLHPPPLSSPSPPQPQIQPQLQSQPVYVTHSYNKYKPSPYVTEYHDYGLPRSPPPQPQYRYYSPPRNYPLAPYHEYYYCNNYPHHYHGNDGGGSSSGSVASFFSDENPNACRIM
ncbi:hypothetical protein SAY87_023754 [Trapa incisa]|uniref:HMA domain-containing protein n=1 Tax=Trapa incisa TaxID=236973 RepID=A0AAN7L405_9MYRT|nr:hypothetical protein SAY87_023754 [Trapa incisa]